MQRGGDGKDGITMRPESGPGHHQDEGTEIDAAGEADVGLGIEMEKGEVIDEPFGGKGVIGEIGPEFRREPQFLKDPGV